MARVTVLLKNLWHRTDGAVTVDWVVLCAALCGLAFICVAYLANGTHNIGMHVTDDLELIETHLVDGVGDKF